MTGGIILSSEHELLRGVLNAISEKRNARYSPLFICGESEEIGEYLAPFLKKYREKHPDAVTERISGEELTQRLLRDLREGTRDVPSRRYEKTELFIIDGTEAVSGRAATMEYLYCAVDAMMENGGQIIFTSRLLPKEMSGIEDRSRTQFEAGIIVDLRGE